MVDKDALVDVVGDDDVVDKDIVVDEVELPVVVDTGACIGVQPCDCGEDGHAIPSEVG